MSDIVPRPDVRTKKLRQSAQGPFRTLPILDRYLESLVQSWLPFEWLDSLLSPSHGASADQVLNSTRKPSLVIDASANRQRIGGRNAVSGL